MRKQPIKFLAILSVLGFAINACKPKAPDDSGIRYVAPRDGLNMREEPSITGKKILTIPKGAQVQKLEERPESFKIDNIEGKWTKISWQGETGWVFGGFLTAPEPKQGGLTGSANNEGSSVEPSPQAILESIQSGNVENRNVYHFWFDPACTLYAGPCAFSEVGCSRAQASCECDRAMKCRVDSIALVQGGVEGIVEAQVASFGGQAEKYRYAIKDVIKDYLANRKNQGGFQNQPLRR